MEGAGHEDHDSDESFEFTSCNDQFNSSDLQGVFSCDAALNDDDDDDDDESYIEIALEPNSSNEEKDYKEGGDETEEEDLNLRISFSSRSPFQEAKVYTLNSKQNSRLFPQCDFTQNIPITTSNSSPYSSSSSAHSSSLSLSWSSSTLNSSSNCNTESSSLRSSEDVPCSPKGTSKWMNSQLPAVKKMLNMLLLSLRESSEGKARSNPNRHSAKQASSDWKLVVQTRKNSSSVTGSINGKIMNFFIKFKSVNVQSMLSFVKPPKATTPRRRLTKNIGGGNGSDNGDLGNCYGDREKSRSIEINMDAFKGVIEAMGMNFSRKDRKTAQARSCPGSIKSSPIHKEMLQSHKKYTRENSIQAAIAHCKRSFNETPEFSF